MKKNKKHILILGTAILAGVITGCAGQKAASPAESTTISEASSKSEKTSGAESGKTVLKVLDNYQGGMVESIMKHFTLRLRSNMNLYLLILIIQNLLH